MEKTWHLPALFDLDSVLPLTLTGAILPPGVWGLDESSPFGTIGLGMIWIWVMPLPPEFPTGMNSMAPVFGFCTMWNVSICCCCLLPLFALWWLPGWCWRGAADTLTLTLGCILIPLPAETPCWASRFVASPPQLTSIKVVGFWCCCNCACEVELLHELEDPRDTPTGCSNVCDTVCWTTGAIWTLIGVVVSVECEIEGIAIFFAPSWVTGGNTLVTLGATAAGVPVAATIDWTGTPVDCEHGVVSWISWGCCCWIFDAVATWSADGTERVLFVTSGPFIALFIGGCWAGIVVILGKLFNWMLLWLLIVILHPSPFERMPPGDAVAG